MGRDLLPIPADACELVDDFRHQFIQVIALVSVTPVQTWGKTVSASYGMTGWSGTICLGRMPLRHYQANSFLAFESVGDLCTYGLEVEPRSTAGCGVHQRATAMMGVEVVL